MLNVDHHLVTFSTHRRSRRRHSELLAPEDLDLVLAHRVKDRSGWAGSMGERRADVLQFLEFLVALLEHIVHASDFVQDR